MANELLPMSDFGKALGHGTIQRARDDLQLDDRHLGDRKVALARAAVESHEGLVVDLARVAGMLSQKFAIAPAGMEGRTLWRSRDTRDGEVYFRVYSHDKRAASNGQDKQAPFSRKPRWEMHFEPSVVMGPEAHVHSHGWRHAPATVPPIPAAYRPNSPAGHFIVWEQEYAEKILTPRDPALLEHVVGDVYVVKAVWDLTELEAAALRGNR